MVDIRLGEEFKRQFKRLKKKYPSHSRKTSKSSVWI